MSRPPLPLTSTCKNGHPVSERFRSGNRWRCRGCATMHNERAKEKEKAYRAEHGRAKKPCCPAGCINVCLCEEL